MKADGQTGKDIAKYLGVKSRDAISVPSVGARGLDPYAPGVDRLRTRGLEAAKPHF
jgi:hypothetical protein